MASGVLIIKQIKPSRLKVDAMRLALLNPLHKMQREILKDFEATVATWNHEVKWLSAVSLALGGPSVTIVTEDPIYRYVNDGTKPHEIWPGAYTGLSDKTVLMFPSAFTPKTEVGVIGSTAGSSGGPMVFTNYKKPYVNHPGNKPRHFDVAIREKWEPRFKDYMEAAMRDVACASGHGM